jgi:hypothetical protein
MVRVQDQVEYMGSKVSMKHAGRGSCRVSCIDEIHALSSPIGVRAGPEMLEAWCKRKKIGPLYINILRVFLGISLVLS